MRRRRPEPAKPPKLARQRILVVDDAPLLLKSLRDTLEFDGHDVTTATWRAGPCRRFPPRANRETPFHLVITDLGMPGWMAGRWPRA